MIPRDVATPFQKSLLLIFVLIGLCFSHPLIGAERAVGSVLVQLSIDGTNRQATVHAPKAAATTACPLIFVFHGHGGTMGNASRSFSLHALWPEAIVVYPQGLNTPGGLTDPEGRRPGWQVRAGAQGDRDLKFFDALLAKLRKDYRVDERRIYATGHSNGGMFVYLLWAARGDVFAAIAPSGAFTLPGLVLGKPLPVLHIAGDEDQLVRFAWQKQTIQRVVAHNRCDAARPTGEHVMLYPSKSSTPVMTYIYPGGHAFPSTARSHIVKFFQQHSQSTPASGKD